jgi:hypothetical protein
MSSIYDRYLKIVTLRNTIMAMFLITLVIALFPLGLPKAINFPAVDAYNITKQVIRPGDIVIWGDEEQTMSQFVNLRDCYRSYIWLLGDLGAKFVCVSLSPTAPTGIEYEIKYANMIGRYNWKYGVDYVILPFLAGEESALAALAENMWTTGNDYYGTPLSNIPIMQNVKKVTDARMLLMGVSSGSYSAFYARQWLLKYPDPVGVNRPYAVSWYGYTEFSPYYPKYVQGAGIRSVDMQLLTGYKGEDVIKNDASNLCWAFTFITLAIAYVLKIYSTAKGEKIEAKVGE